MLDSQSRVGIYDPKFLHTKARIGFAFLLQIKPPGLGRLCQSLALVETKTSSRRLVAYWEVQLGYQGPRLVSLDLEKPPQISLSSRRSGPCIDLPDGFGVLGSGFGVAVLKHVMTQISNLIAPGESSY